MSKSATARLCEVSASLAGLVSEGTKLWDPHVMRSEHMCHRYTRSLLLFLPCLLTLYGQDGMYTHINWVKQLIFAQQKRYDN